MSELMNEDALSAYLDDELDPAARAEVEARLNESHEWRAILDELRETRGALRALPPVDASPEFWQRVMVGDAVVDLGVERRKRARRSAWKVAAVGVAAAVVIVVGVAAIPQQEKVTPSVATFTNAHAARSSVGHDVVSNLASVGVPGFGR